MVKTKLKRLLLALLAAHLAGCSFAPTYHAPEVAIPSTFKESEAWQPATPQDHMQRGQWWLAFGDAKLNELQASVEHSNTDLALAVARFDAASAFARELGAEQLPSVDLYGSGARNRQSNNRPLRGSNQPNVYTADSVGVHMAYEVDLWGRIRDEVAIGAAGVDAAKADLASARLSLHAQLAELYILVRGYDAESALLDETIKAYKQALKLTENRHIGGITSGLDVARAQTQLADALAEATELLSQRALAEHAIAELSGLSTTSLSIPVNTEPLHIPELPAVLPSSLLQRRPDIAAAERRVYAANAGIGVAQAAFYPRIGLTGDFGWQNTGGALISAPERFWAIGPQALLSVFDAGLHQARLARSKAEFDAAAAHYRGTVIAALRETEDQLLLSRLLSNESEEEAVAVNAALQALNIATHRYQEGAANYLEVVTAQTATLRARRSALHLNTRRLRAQVNLIRALGGDTMPDDHMTAAATHREKSLP